MPKPVSLETLRIIFEAAGKAARNGVDVTVRLPKGSETIEITFRKHTSPRAVKQNPASQKVKKRTGRDFEKASKYLLGGEKEKTKPYQSNVPGILAARIGFNQAAKNPETN